MRGIAVGSVAASVPDEVHGHRRDAFGDGVNGLREGTGIADTDTAAM